jgi:hypothetical protein
LVTLKYLELFMNKYSICLIGLSLLFGATFALAEGHHGRGDWQNHQQDLVTGATDGDGNVTQATLEGAMAAESKTRADKLFAELSPSGNPVPAVQLSDFLKNRMGGGERWHKDGSCGGDPAQVPMN